MARRVRLLIYEGPEEWIRYQRAHDGVQRVKRLQEWTSKWPSDSTITSIELDPCRMTLEEVARIMVLGWHEHWRQKERAWWRGERYAE